MSNVYSCISSQLPNDFKSLKDFLIHMILKVINLEFQDTVLEITDFTHINN